MSSNGEEGAESEEGRQSGSDTVRRFFKLEQELGPFELGDGTDAPRCYHERTDNYDERTDNYDERTVNYEGSKLSHQRHQHVHEVKANARTGAQRDDSTYLSPGASAGSADRNSSPPLGSSAVSSLIRFSTFFSTVVCWFCSSMAERQVKRTRSVQRLNCGASQACQRLNRGAVKRVKN